MGPLHLPHLITTSQRLLGTTEQVLSEKERLEVIVALLAASELPGSRKGIAIEQARKISHGLDDYIVRTSIAHRNSTLLRLKGQVTESNNVLAGPLRESEHTFQMNAQAGHSKYTGQMHTQLGYLKLSRALNFTQQELLSEAVEEFKSWEPLNSKSPSTMERIAFIKLITNFGKVLRFQGRFDEALDCLQKMYEEVKDVEMFKDTRPDLVCNLADTLIDLGKPAPAQKLLEAELASSYTQREENSAASESSRLLLAGSSIQPAYPCEADCRCGELLKTIKPGSYAELRSTKNLQLSLAESYIQQGMLCIADLCYEGLSKTIKPGSDAELRWTVGKGKVACLRSQWEDAYQRWSRALTLVTEVFVLGPTNSPYSAVAILKSMSAVSLELRRDVDAKALLGKAEEYEAACNSGGCKHWIPGFRSQWLVRLNNP